MHHSLDSRSGICDDDAIVTDNLANNHSSSGKYQERESKASMKLSDDILMFLISEMF